MWDVDSFEHMLETYSLPNLTDFDPDDLLQNNEEGV